MTLAVVSLAIVAYALVSKRLASTPVTGPMIFMVVGVLLGPAVLGVIEGPEDRRGLEALLEAALALLLFTDALEISAGDWRAKSRLPLRLLLVGMPLTMLLGWVGAWAMFGGVGVWTAALIAICLAPTDAALGQAVVSDTRVPSSIRQALNIESGLNDGLALPFFLLALAAAEEFETGTPAPFEVFFRSLFLASLVGGAVGWLGAWLLVRSRDRGWIGREWSQIATVSLVLLAFALADQAGGSGFIATWVAGVAFGRTVKGRMTDTPVLAEDLGGWLATVSFLGFGAILLGPILGDVTWQIMVYALMSLTLIRVIPVGLSFLGTGLSGATVLFVGWFGPRGLASIVFALLAAEAALPDGSAIAETVFVTVGLSILLHGATAVIGAERYAAWYERVLTKRPTIPESLDVGEHEIRRRLLGSEIPKGRS